MSDDLITKPFSIFFVLESDTEPNDILNHFSSDTAFGSVSIGDFIDTSCWEEEGLLEAVRVCHIFSNLGRGPVHRTTLYCRWVHRNKRTIDFSSLKKKT